MQPVVLGVALLLMAVVAMIFIGAVASVNAQSELSNVDQRRRNIIWALVVVGVVAALGTLRPWPHALAEGEDIIQVNATSAQWYWDIDTYELPLNQKIQFNLHAEDVNHGFGVVDASGTLLFQAQAMPGYVNKVQYVFDQPGTYKVICLEFCGVGHHEMIDEFEVIGDAKDRGDAKG